MAHTADVRLAGAPDLWVFGYGSLMWNPGFEFIERRSAQVMGFHRAFCIFSTHHRGSHAKPGLVLGLDRGGSCQGQAYRIATEDRRTVLAYLRKREQVSGVYREAGVWLDMADDDGNPRLVRGTAFVAERCHPNYTGPMTVFERARLIRAAHGQSGPNVEYLVHTWRQLRAAGIVDPHIERIVSQVGGLFASREGTGIKASSEVLIRATRNHRPFAPLMRRHARRRFMHRLKLDALNS